MNVSVVSPLWYRIAPLTVRLRRDTSVHRHTYMGKTWYVLQDRVSGRFMRFTPEAYQLIGRMDGTRTIRDLYEEVKIRLAEKMPSQREVVSLVGQLYRANVILTDEAPNVGSMEKRSQKAKTQKLTRQFMMPLAIRVPLLDPEKFLQQTKILSRILFSVPAFLVWMLIVAMGVTQAGVHWEALTGNMSDRVLAQENLLLMALIYPVVKAVHELGHAYAVKRFDGEVHEIGVMLLAFYPVPYVDATAATAFRSKRERMMVGMAGILVEVALAAIAMMVWVMAEPGVVRAICMNVMIISGVSTVLFNGNPLLRFDAYYVLSDALEIPNLAPRGSQYIAYRTKRAFGIRTAINPAETAREAFWLGGYAIASFCYRILVMIAISLVIASKYLFVGILLAMWSVYLLLVHPIFKLISAPMRDGELMMHAKRLYMVGGALFIALLLLLFVMPVPYATRTEGVVWVKQDAIVRAGATGFVGAVHETSSATVEPGQSILSLSNPELEADRNLLQAKLQEAQETFRANLRDANAAEVMRQRVSLYEEELARVERDIAALTVSSPVQGALNLIGENDLEGEFVKRGQRLGFVSSPEYLQVLVPITDDVIDQVRQDSQSIEVRFAGARRDVRDANIVRVFPAATNKLPSPVLSLEGGGRMALDPSAKEDLTTFREFFMVELDVEGMSSRPVEERAYILFRHSAEPIGYRWLRALRRAFLRQFDV